MARKKGAPNIAVSAPTGREKPFKRDLDTSSERRRRMLPNNALDGRRYL